MRILLSIFLLTICSLCPGQLIKTDLVHVKLVMDTSVIVPGKPFHLGLVYDIAPGWHIYWTNPGDAGLATKAEIHLPAGFTSTPIVFPMPTQFVMPGGIVCYGYNSQLMLITTVTPPADLPAGQNVLISADTKYLVCESVCIDGKQNVSFNFPVGRGAGLANIDLFNHWESLIPVPANQALIVRAITPEDDSITIQWDLPVTEVQFFPGASTAVSIGHITVVPQGQETQILFVPKYFDKTKLAPLPCVVGFLDPHGIRRAIEFPLRLRAGG